MSDTPLKTEGTEQDSATEEPSAEAIEEAGDDDAGKKKSSKPAKQHSRQKLRAAAAAAAAASKTKAKPVGTAVIGERKKKKSPVTHPRTLDMVVEAVKELRDHRGSSVQAIRSWILGNYKTVRPDMIRVMLKRALPQGLDEGLLARPKKQTETQVLSGRYRVGAGEKREVAPVEKKVQPTRAKPKVEVKKVSVKVKTKSKKKVESKKAVSPPSKSKLKVSVGTPPPKISLTSTKKLAVASPKSSKKSSPVVASPIKKSHKKKDKKRDSSSPKSSKKKSPSKKKSSRK